MDDDGRLLSCTCCGTVNRVYDLLQAEHWIDPDRYTCELCWAEARAGWDQPPLFRQLPGVREETPAYDPMMAAIPFGDPD